MWTLYLIVLLSKPQVLEYERPFKTEAECVKMAAVKAPEFKVKYPGVPFRLECHRD